MPHRKAKLEASKTSLAIDFLVVGAGIAGLSCAIALSRVGHRVVVVEKDDGTPQLSSGIKVPPNMSKILIDWGLEPALKSLALSSHHMTILSYTKGDIAHSVVWERELLEEGGGEFLLVHHAELRDLLKTKALSLGVCIKYNSKVASVDSESPKSASRPSLKLTSGEVLDADVIIGAGGRLSGIREQVLHQHDPLNPTGVVMLGTSIPQSLISQEPNLHLFSRACSEQTMLYFYGDRFGAIVYPLGGNKELALSIYVREDGSFTSSRKYDLNTVTVERALKVMGTCDPRLYQLARLAGPPNTPIVPITAFESPSIADWLHPTAPIVILGDAAHPMMVGAMYPPSLAVEDAVCLAEIFSHLSRHDQIRFFLDGFQEIRQPRCQRVEKAEHFFLNQLLFPIAPSADGVTQISPPGLEELLEIFAYEATDDANNWWVEWGLLRERAKALEKDDDHAN
ncbi:hypothetical protein JAAARDRAFT_35975 [Jaapia argillacea MUCL 33604]|uniref:FAD-binding domain-containing protein n=1 Tax=Jaapia argillacea MUCL 33604 TaxID=933084 RepID=A0A067PRA7_9AGAM|nr:hypothetical protein JAAARDRAFT_35975 [Jaapia argillacea MUCL 33604]